MATNHVESNLVGIYISTVLTSPVDADWKEIVCGTDVGLDGSADVTTKKTKCGVIKTVSATGWTITGSGTANHTPGTGKLSADDLLGLQDGATPVLVKLEYATDDALYNRHGKGVFSKYSEKGSEGGAIEFDFTIDISGSVTIV